MSDNDNHGLLSLDELCGENSVRNVLVEKHPDARPLHEDALVKNKIMDPPTVHPIQFEQISADKVRAAALRIKGSAGPSGVDADGWRRLLVSFHCE